jgi:hypothetical protein
MNSPYVHPFQLPKKDWEYPLNKVAKHKEAAISVVILFATKQTDGVVLYSFITPQGINTITDEQLEQDWYIDKEEE